MIFVCAISPGQDLFNDVSFPDTSLQERFGGSTQSWPNNAVEERVREYAFSDGVMTERCPLHNHVAT